MHYPQKLAYNNFHGTVAMQNESQTMQPTQKIASALVKAQKSFGSALKTKTNVAFSRNGNGGQYADLASCIDAVMNALNENGIMLMQPTHECEAGVIVETLFIHESGETISSGKLHVPATKHDAQGYGSAMTYARRYSLMSACGIAPEDDDGNAASNKPAAKKQEKAPVISEEQVASLEALIEEVNADKKELLAWVERNANTEVKKLDQIPVMAYTHVIKALEGKRK